MTRLKVLVTGANGMLADSLCPLLRKEGYEVYLSDLSVTEDVFNLDVRQREQIDDFLKTHKVDIIYHLAAETDVDKCELNQAHAYETNAKGTENVALGCRQYGCTLVYISSGAVFDGEKMNGYTEEDPPNPISVYGKSKLDGERIIQSLLSKYYIVRAGWMIGGYNKDKKFVWKIVQLLKTKKEIPVVIDKIGSPTFTNDFSRGLVSIVAAGKYGLYHCVNKGICTRFDIAEKIVEYLGKKDVVLKPVGSEYFPLPAPRWKSEALLNFRLSNMGMDIMRPWQDSLREYLADIR